MREGYIYFIESEEQSAIKIGFAMDLNFRLGALQAGNPAKLTVLYHVRGTQATERAIHKRFKHLRIAREWFRDDNELHEYMDALEGLVRNALLERHRRESFPDPKAILDAFDEVLLPPKEVLNARC